MKGPTLRHSYQAPPADSCPIGTQVLQQKLRAHILMMFVRVFIYGGPIETETLWIPVKRMDSSVLEVSDVSLYQS